MFKLGSCGHVCVDAGVLLLPAWDLQQQQLPLQPRLCVTQSSRVSGFPQRLLPSRREGNQHTHTVNGHTAHVAIDNSKYSILSL